MAFKVPTSQYKPVIITPQKTSKRESCANCPFHGAKVGTRGPADSRIMIVGESPGKQEIKGGLPFVGPSWRVMEHALKQCGLEWEEPFVTNAMHCWPGTGDQKSEEKVNLAARCCHDQLIVEINMHPRKLMFVLGNGALRSVTNNYGLKITQNRGRYISGDLCKEITSVEHAVAAVHPAFILRGGGSFRQFQGDILYGLDLYNGGSQKRIADVEWIILDNSYLLHKLYIALAARPMGTPIAADLETGSDPSDLEGPGGLNHVDDAILMCGVAYREGEVYIIPEHLMAHPITRKIFQLQNLVWVWHNGKFDVKFLWSAGIPEATVDHDTMLMSYTLDERRGVHDLEEVAHDWIGSPRWKNILDKHKKKGQSYRAIPLDILYRYAAYDISNTLAIYRIMKPMIDTDPLNKMIYYKTFIPASEYLAHLEDTGLGVDAEKVHQNLERLNKQLEPFAEIIFSAALQFTSSNYSPKLLNSPKQLSQLLYEDLAIPSKDKGTGDEVLNELPNHPVVVALRNYRKLAKQRSTYVLPLIDHPDEKGRIIPARLASDGRMHTTFKLHGTATGRLACGDPMNLQNIPRDEDMRGQFVPRPRNIFIEPDLNQAELRSLAVMSKDPALCAIYETTGDGPGLHDVVRAEMFGNPGDWSTLQLQAYIDRFFITVKDEEAIIKAILDEQKMKAKNVNFGIVYGITAFGLGDQTGDSPKVAQTYLDAWAHKFPEAWKFIQQCKNAPRLGQNLRTPFGNRKRHYVVTQENISALQNEAANFPHQSTASHIMLHGGIRVHRRYRDDYDARICNTVHDSMLIDCPNVPFLIRQIVEDITQVLQDIPREWGMTRIPFVADAKIGTRWGRSEQIGYDKWLKKQYQLGTLVA